MAIKVTDAKRGMVIEYQGELYQITKYDHVTPGNWRAIHHLHLKNLRSGKQKEVRMSTSDQIEVQYVESRKCQYLYKDANGCVFMDLENFEQFHLAPDVVADDMRWVPEGSEVAVLYVGGVAISLQLESAVVLEVIEAEEAARGDTVSNVQKTVTLETGAEIKVPAHIKQGEKIKVNTENGDFGGRAN